jgi:hypothetical protein
VNNPPNKVWVQLTHPPAAVIARLEAAYPGLYVIQTGLPRTVREIRALQRSVDSSTWHAKGVDVVWTGPQSGYLGAGVSSDVARAQAFFDAKYGRGAVRVVHGEPFAIGAAG